jgi:hypothetical protein
MWRISCVVLLLDLALAPATVAAETAGHVPKLLISTDWGAQILEDDNRVAGGLAVTARRPSRNAILHATAQTQFVGGIFGVRFGGIFGASYTTPYQDRKLDSVTSYGNKTVYTGTITTYHGRKIRGVAGLSLSASASVFGYGDDSNLQLEAGYGMCAQNCFEVQYVHDAANGGNGARIAGTWAFGDAKFHGVLRYAVEGIYGGDMQFAMMTLGIGFGSGYHWK